MIDKLLNSENKKCKYGKEEQDITSCQYIYLHWPRLLSN